MKALIQQSDARVSAALCSILEKRGHVSIATSTFRQSVSALDSDATIDLVISDARNPDSPENLLRFVKSQARLRWIPVVISCAACSPSILQANLKLGACGILAVPFTEEALLAQVAKALENGKRRVLVVDDDNLVRELLKDTLELERFQVVTACDGEDALAALEKVKIHAVVSDIMMPGLSGLQLLTQIKSTRPELPVILITGLKEKYKPDEVLAAGANGWFAKPFKNVELVRTLRSVIITHSQPASNVVMGQPSPAL